MQAREAGDGLARDARLVRGHARRARELAHGVPDGSRGTHQDARVDVRQRRAAVQAVGLEQRERAHHTRGGAGLLPPLAAAVALAAALRRRRLLRLCSRGTTRTAAIKAWVTA